MSTSTIKIGYDSIRATLARDDSDINRLVEIFLSNSNNKKKIIGLDTERSFVQGDHEYPTESILAFLELCDGDNCLIVPLRYIPFLSPIFSTSQISPSCELV
ncbi:hypothetical protein V5N11_018666 [Cardamine amara subsp. amara]|uniref:Uncharacterized protein n=1 Tax=Cardamine amara subsp. amara TaxID=228776 RepID=A0ABD1BBA9_CARAN